MLLIVKKSKRDDAGQLAEILTEARLYKTAHGDNAWGSKPVGAEEMEARIAKGNTYSARIGDKIVGTILLLWEDKLTWGEQPAVAGYAHQLAVKNGYRGQNLGAQILDWASKKTEVNRRSFLRIDFPPDNEGLKRYYTALGFTFVEKRLVETSRSTYTAGLYQRPVS